MAIYGERKGNYSLKLVKHRLPGAVSDELFPDLADYVVHYVDVDGGDIGGHSRR